MGKIFRSCNGESIFRSPAPADGARLHRLATLAGTLDVNSEYAYMLSGLHHADSCVLAEWEKETVGFVTGYPIPERASALLPAPGGMRMFIWQVGVHPDFRRRGLAHAMLLSLLTRTANRQTRFIETTVGSSNAASLRMFRSVARMLDTEIAPVSTLDAAFFHAPHEEETVYRIGPFLPFT
jgi:L-2,4-diaminobutyric acid acetyltransferase